MRFPMLLDATMFLDIKEELGDLFLQVVFHQPDCAG